ncbi:MAG: LPXTG cell wall anchor domain-containing protein [Nanoarchaeota archaeon]|nr:LPXTG cell wall anchor domain-containing protein [Nanoarchaeota archaeon]
MRESELAQECANLEMNKETCEPIATKYLSRNKGIPPVTNTQLVSIGILLLLAIMLFLKKKK